jgi:DNA-binding transcriptional LysR family regulator
MPTRWDALSGHRVVGLRSLTTGNTRPLEFVVDGVLRAVETPATLTVTGPESYLSSARLGLGLVQVPRFHAEADLARGSLVAVLVDTPPPQVPVSLLYPENRQLSPRVRAFLDWAVREFAKHNQSE